MNFASLLSFFGILVVIHIADGSIIRVRNYHITAKSETDTIRLSNAVSGADCIDSCTGSCAFVAYDTATGVCRGFTSRTDPWIQRKAGHTLLGWTNKTMTQLTAVEYDFGDFVVDIDNKPYLQDRSYQPTLGLTVDGSSTCLNLCLIVSRCNAASYEISSKNCYLKDITRHALTRKPIRNPDAVSYVFPSTHDSTNE